MSMLAYDILQAALKDMGMREPDEILQVVNDQIIEKLQKSNTGGTQDGMDLTLCRLNKASGILTYAGAKNELWVASGPGIQIYPVDKSSIGDKAGLLFTKHEVKLRENDLVYLFTDGYADQKGGPENKKYMRSKFRNLLSEIAALPCSQQQARLEAEFRSWKGDLRQRDDVLVVGFKVRTSSPS
jgi:serine phosphatase RsbU (regulator of sigma subunit)